MTLHRDADTRAQLAELKRKVKALESPDKEVRRKAFRQARRERQKAIGKPAVGQRRPRVRDNGFLAFLRRLPCIAGLVEGGCSGPIEAAHLRFSDFARARINPGMGCKPSDQFANPLCDGHHIHDQHEGRERSFWERLGVDPADLCADLYAAYLAGEDGEPIVRRHTQGSIR